MEIRFIETVPRRGYRFVANVKRVEAVNPVTQEGTPVTSPAEEGARASQSSNEAATDPRPSQILTGDSLVPAKPSSTRIVIGEIKRHKLGAWLTLAVLVLAAGFFAYRSSTSQPGRLIESIAVLPFQNESGSPDVEYLSDGMTESLINSLSQVPGLSVKGRSAVFRYKGKEVEPQQVASELSVQAVLSARFVERGDDLTLYLSLVDGRNGNQLWGERYNRKLRDVLALQSQMTLDVSQKLRARLSGADKQKVAKNYTENTEAYQLYLKGRHHRLKQTRSEIQTGISYFEQAIAIDSSYALAHMGIADGYWGLAFAGEMLSTEVLPKAKAAVQKAIVIDDNLAEAHAILGNITFWYDWDWNEAENQFKRALQLSPDSGDNHWFYAQFLAKLGRFAEARAEIERALELDPISLQKKQTDAQILYFAGRYDEALAKFQNALELNPSFWQTHSLASSVYIEKGMFVEAVAAARKARQPSDTNTNPVAFLCIALAKSGKRAEARAELENLLKLSTERYVSPYSIAMIYDGLGESREALAWLERGYEQRHVRMPFLNFGPRWNALRDDPRFQDLLRRVGIPHDLGDRFQGR